MADYSPSQNVTANVGSIDGLEYQTNGTNRLKGSFPKLVTSLEQIKDHLLNDALPLLDTLGIEKVSRISSRYFATDSVIKELHQLSGLEIGYTRCQIEAKIPLGSIFNAEGVSAPVWWVWIGANAKGRATNEELKSVLRDKYIKSVNYWTPAKHEALSDYKIVAIGTKERISVYQPGEIPESITITIITDDVATQIANLYAERITAYVADNGNYKYIRDTIAASTDTVLFALLEKGTNKIAGCVANEFCKYPVVLPNEEAREVLICESNDWIKRKDVPRSAFISLLSTAMKNAVTRNVRVIEAECVPESFSAAGTVGFETAGQLERNSYVHTDGENLELNDRSTQEMYRRFNSLWLYYLTPASRAWEYWKIL